MEREGERGASSEGKDRQYGDWIARQLGADWVEVEPGIFEPPGAHRQREEPEQEPVPEAVAEGETLDDALRPRARETQDDRELADPSGRRGWWRRR